MELGDALSVNHPFHILSPMRSEHRSHHIGSTNALAFNLLNPGSLDEHRGRDTARRRASCPIHMSQAFAVRCNQSPKQGAQETGLRGRLRATTTHD